MGQKPPAWTRSDQQIGQVPLALSQDVDTTGVHPGSGQDAHALADQIVRQQQSVINRFVAKQRQQIEIGALDVHKAVLPLDGMEVYYSHVQGLERMHYHISPQAEALQPKPEALEEPEVKVLERPIPEVLEPPKEEQKPELEQPDFLAIDIPCFLAVEFGDGAGDP
jgi:hypothetical protein